MSVQVHLSASAAYKHISTSQHMYILHIYVKTHACIGIFGHFVFCICVQVYARSRPTTATGRSAAALHRIAKQLYCSIRAIDHVPLSESQSDVGRAERPEQASVTGLLDDCYAPLISTRTHQTNLTWMADEVHLYASMDVLVSVELRAIWYILKFKPFLLYLITYIEM